MPSTSQNLVRHTESTALPSPRFSLPAQRGLLHLLLTKLFGFFVSLALRLTCRTNKLSVTGLDIFEKYAEQGNNIFAFWHSRMFYLAYFYATHAKTKKVSVLISLSRDGDYGVAVARRLKQDVVRGSTAKGALQATRKLAAKLAEGYNVAITPDGPRGPARIANDGIIKLAQLTGARIIPVSYDATRKHLLKSWDNFIILWPFGKVHLGFAAPITVSRNITRDQCRQYRAQLEQTLRDLDHLCAEKLTADNPL